MNFRKLIIPVAISLAILATSIAAQTDTQDSQPTLFIIGDSTVKNTSNGQLGWGDPIKDFFDLSKIKIENRARGGRSTRTFQSGMRALKNLTLNNYLRTEPKTSSAEMQTTEVIKLWPNGAPGSVGSTPDDIPTLTPFFPKEKVNGSAVIVCPGGGYQHLADHEGRPVAEWLNSIGVTAFVLKYRIGPRYHHPAPLQDAARAVRLVRSRAAEWKIDPKRIGVLGFSAGGHLASTIGTHFDSGQADAADVIDRVSSRPDLLVLIYPVITMGEFTHAGSKKQLLGDNPTPEMVKLLSNEEQVTKETPPTFLVHTANDAAVPIENSLRFAEALRKVGVAFELHVYERGQHGFGLAPDDPILSTWPARAADWLRLQGF